HSRLPRGRQDRHRAQGVRRRLLAPLRVLLRRRGAGGGAALFHGRGDRRPGSGQGHLRRRGRGPGVPVGHGRRAAPDGRAARRHRDLAGRAGPPAGEGAPRGCAGRADVSRRMRLRELLPDVAGIPEALEVTGLVLDSRHVRPGNGFVAIAGFGTHGLHFAGSALADGAAAVLYEPPVPGDVPPPPAGAIAVPGLRARMGAMADQVHGRPSAAMSTVAVTGTNGKTSTVQLLAQAWELLGRRAATIGTLGAGLHGQVEPTGFNTPLVLQVHELLAGLRDAGAEAVAMETSSHALDQGRVDAVHFEVGVFTNLTRDHLDYHGDMATYGAAKERLFAFPGMAAAVVNVDDAFGRALAARLPAGLRRIGTSARGDAGAEVAATGIAFDAAGIAFSLRLGDAVQRVRSPLLGRFNVDNLLAVAGVLHAQGVAPDAIAGVLGRLQPIPGRMNRLGGTDGLPLVVVDYAHTPDALVQALEGVRAHAAGRITCVFGCGG